MAQFRGLVRWVREYEYKMHSEEDYRLPNNIMDLTVFAITQELNELDSCGLHYSTENSVRHKSMSNLIGPAVD